jgi:hypothetical protein
VRHSTEGKVVHRSASASTPFRLAVHTHIHTKVPNSRRMAWTGRFGKEGQIFTGCEPSQIWGISRKELPGNNAGG